ncbi:hypothetical protein GGR51DRAFT_556792 [Nemania sp. FL0031]|nr:hypothetical protein GGR51DRAFT_556792 [Nemania sp. FL0031]
MQFATFFLAALSMGSALATPIAGFQPFDQAATAVATAHTVIQEQVASINILLKDAPTDETVTKIQKSLVTVTAQVSGLHASVLALGDFGSTPLSDAQLAEVPEFAENFKGIFISIEALGKKITSAGLSVDVFAQIKPELQLVLSIASPIARPILAFVKVAAAIHVKLFTPVTTVLVNIQSLVTLVIGPLSGLKLTVA